MKATSEIFGWNKSKLWSWDEAEVTALSYFPSGHYSLAAVVTGTSQSSALLALFLPLIWENRSFHNGTEFLKAEQLSKDNEVW